jgi:hypothetical protein
MNKELKKWIEENIRVDVDNGGVRISLIVEKTLFEISFLLSKPIATYHFLVENDEEVHQFGYLKECDGRSYVIRTPWVNHKHQVEET